MPNSKQHKPSHAQESFKMSKGQRQCGIAVAVIAVVIGLSVVVSPKPEDEEAKTVKAAAPTATKGMSSSGAVTELDDATFDSFVASNPNGVLVDFYKKDCSWCKKLAPEFDKAAKELKSSGGPPLAAIGMDAGAEVMGKLEITKFPTVLWFYKGEKVLELERAPEKPAAEIAKWAEWAVRPSVQDLTPADFEEGLPTLRSTLHARGRFFAGFNRGSEGVREALEAAAVRNKAKSVFVYITEESPGTASLKAYGPDDSYDEEYTGEMTADAVAKWARGIIEKARPPKEEKAAGDKTAADKAIEQLQKAQESLGAEATPEER